MSDELSFDEPAELVESILPYNYFPAALGVLAASPDPMNRVVLLLPDEKEGQRRETVYHVVSRDTLAALKDPSAFGRFLKDRNISEEYAHKRCFLGPPTRMEETPPDRPNRLDFAPVSVENADIVTQVAVIIDIGIAFWNPVFRSNAGPRFKAMQYLDFDAFVRGQPALAALTDTEIGAYCTAADQPGGQSAVVAALGARFPDSYFGRKGGAEPGTIWHGTAMADLMAGLPRTAPDQTALMGIELPMAVLRDADGDNLGAVLTLLVEAALAMTVSFPHAKLVIALPWGFTGGPQLGNHPFAATLDKVLAQHANRDVTLLLPMGNQLQDQCCAHLPPSQMGAAENAVIWRLPPDDFSQNTAEIHVTATGPVRHQTVRLTAPNGTVRLLLLREFSRAWIRRDGVIIGGIVRMKDTATGPRLRMTFLPTGWRSAVARPALAGDWGLSFHAQDDVRIWVLRDDRDWPLDKALPRRASHLFDPHYRVHDQHGAFGMTDDPDAMVVRSGTASVLATASAVTSVQADGTVGARAPEPAFYSGQTSFATAADRRQVVDAGRPGRGVLAAANGTAQMRRVSGTSAAVALAARQELQFPARPPS